jgi:serine phosphatase RsbU (regulator of sigma subunit)
MKNINPDIALLCVSILIFLYYIVINLFRRFQSPENKLFVLFNLLFAANNALLLYIIFINKTENLTELSKYSFSLLVFTQLVYFYIMLLYPGWEKRLSGLFYLLFTVPSIIGIVLTIFTDTIISKAISDGILINQYGKYLFIFLCIYGVYFLSIIITAVLKYKRMENFSFKTQLPPMVFFICAGIIVFISFYVVLPAYYNSNKYTVTGLTVYGVSAAYIMNYALSGAQYIDFRKLLLKAFFRVAIIVLLFILVYLFFTEITPLDFMRSSRNYIGGLIAFSFFCLMMYGIFKFPADRISSKKDRSMTDSFKKVSAMIDEFSGMKKQKIDWNSLYSRCIDDVCELLYIEKAVLFQLNKESAIYEPFHSYNENSDISDLTGNDEIVKILNKYKRIIDKSFIYTDNEFRGYTKLLEFFTNKKFNTALPIFANKNLAGILILGNTEQKWNYADFINSLEEYRIEISTLLENLIFSEEIRRTQVLKRDRMVVKNIKKHIIPGSLKNIEGIKVSSLYINNSSFGGDYFNSANINSDKLGIFLANTSDIGIESALLSLQINSVFLSQADLHSSPESLLNVLNQVLCTSQFTEKYASSFYMIYNNASREIAFANAAFNPLIVFDPRKDNFVDFDAEGVPMGIDLAFHYRSRALTVPHDGIGVCCSPGLSAALDSSGNNYSIDKIKDIIRINKNDTPAVLVKKIYNDFKNFSAAGLLSDITVIVFRAA